MPQFDKGASVSISKEALIAFNQHHLLDAIETLEKVSGEVKVRAVLHIYQGDKKWWAQITLSLPGEVLEDTLEETQFRPSEHGISVEEVYGSLSGPGRPTKYPWKDWTNGAVWEVTKEKHFPDTTPENFRLGLYQKATSLEKKVKTRVKGDSVIFQFLSQGE
jgi:hypothetical protein